jgi:putative phosphoesterase
MKIAVLSDIHGNLEAIKAVIDDIDNQNIDKIFICGDLAMAGPEPVEALDFIINLAKDREVSVIMGNTDEMIVKSTGEPDDPYTPPNEIMTEALRYAQKALRADQKEYLSKLPAQITAKIGKLELLLVHGSPRRINEDIMPGLEIEQVKELIGRAKEDIIFCGHTHLPAIYNLGRQVVVNAGSVGRPFSDMPKACYAILFYPDLSTKDFQVSHRLVKYNHHFAAEKLSKLPFKGADKLGQMLIKATSRYP